MPNPGSHATAMPDAKNQPHGTEPPPAQPSNASGQPMPRRTSSEKSVTLRHHRLARDATMKNQASSANPASPAKRVPQLSVSKAPTSSPRQNSSDESHDTGRSEPKRWFDQSNENPTASYSHAMDVDPPFYQKETDSSNDDVPKPTYPQHLRPGASTSLQPAITQTHTQTQSSSAGDYRSVIDDLTVEIQRLKEELKKYKQLGPDLLKKEKLFEIKCHGLPKRKKRELESTLRDFAAGLSETPSAEVSSSRKKSSRHTNRLYSGSGSMSKHASSSSGSNSRPVDSAYASMSVGNNSSGAPHNRPSIGTRARSSEQKVESYLKDMPEGLYPRQTVLSDKDKKKLVVKRLEQLFTGKISGKNLNRHAPTPAAGNAAAANAAANNTAANNLLGSVVSEATTTHAAGVHQPPTLGATPSMNAPAGSAEATREARILAPEESSSGNGKKSRSRDNASTENSNGDQTESGGNGAAVNEANVSPPNAPPPEQRPTRPRDLDPDRIQNPSENMDYIRHLGLVPPELLSEPRAQDVAPDADGWVYLNLLCNLAQLHMINVTPDFIRQAVSEKSAKFQLSPDGRKIRWRGGTEGTKFSSDTSGDNSQRSPSTDETDGSDGHRKKQKTVTATGNGAQPTSGDDFTSAHSSKDPSKFGPQNPGSSEGFQYKPLFAHQSSSAEQTSLGDTVSSLGPAEDSNIGESRWGNSGSGSSQRKKRRHDGAIIYYSGAPFCTDLSGDPGDSSSATYMASSGQEQDATTTTQQQSCTPRSDLSEGVFVRPEPPQRTTSGSALKVRPLSDENRAIFNELKSAEPELCVPGLTTSDDSDDNSDDIEAEFSWSDTRQYLQVMPLEPCGLGGVLPDDHFMVVVTTKRPTEADEDTPEVTQQLKQSEEAVTDAVVNRLASMSTSSPRPPPSLASRSRSPTPPVEIEYVSGRIKRLAPVPLPPPALFCPTFSSGSESSSDASMSSDADDDDGHEFGEGLVGRRVNPHNSDNPYPDDEEMTSGDEEGEEPDDGDEPRRAPGSESRSPGVFKGKGPVEGPVPRELGIALPPRAPVRRTSSSAIAAAGTVRGRSKSMSADLPRSGTSNATVGDAESGYSTSGEGSG